MTDFESESLWLEKVRDCIKSNMINTEDSKTESKRELIEYRNFLWEEYPHEKGALIDNNDFNQSVEESHKSEAAYDRITRRQRLIKEIYSTPYFARIDFLYDGDKIAEKFYIGKSSFIDDKTKDMLVYDWRAPVSSMFYDYETGRAGYSCPDGEITGDMTLKRQYIIENGKLTSMFESSVAIEDEILQRALASASEEHMKNIVTTIQREQNKAVRNESSDVLIVSGSAGSGKTSVALHRISYLLYHHRETLNEKNILIFSPNDIFNEYISDVLPSLGESNVMQTTFGDFAENTLVKPKQSYFDYLEQLLNGKITDERLKSIVQKGTPEFTRFIEQYIDEIRKKGIEFKDIYDNGDIVMSADEMLEIFKQCHRVFKTEQCIDKVKAKFFEHTKEQMQKRIPVLKAQLTEEKGVGYFFNDDELTSNARALWHREFLRLASDFEQINTIDCYDLYNKISNLYFREQYNNSENILYEDVAPILYIKLLTGQIKPVNDIKHMIIDEAQDYNFLQYRLLARLFENAKFTILGDVNQVLAVHKPQNFEYIKAAFDNKSLNMTELKKSYRSTVEISCFADRILSKTNAENVLRHGEAPIEMTFENADKKVEFICDLIKHKQEDFKTTAIITKTKFQAKMLYKLLSSEINLKLIADENALFTKGIMIMPSYLSKGLEFDCVIVDETAVQRLEQILILRKLNISIKDIRRIFNTSGSEVVLEVLGKKVDAIDEEVSLLHELKEIILDFIRQIEQSDFGKESDVKLLYEKAKEIEMQLVNVDYEGNPSNVNRLLEVTKKLERLPVAIRKYPRFSICFDGFGSDEKTREAFMLYEKAFGAIKTWEDQPYESGPGNLHIGMEINGYDFLLKTQGPGIPGGGVNCGMHFNNDDDWKQAYDALTREGSDYSTQSWPHAPISGLVTDKFGVSWWLHT